MRVLLILFSIQIYASHAAADTLDYFLLESKNNKSSNYLVLADMFSYRDINLTSTATSDQFVYGTSQGIALGLRTQQIFMVSLVYRQNSANVRRTTGVAFRAYLPGFYLIGGSIQNLIIDFASRRFHTYIEAEVGLSTNVDPTTQLSSRYFENAGRLGFEITLLKGFFIDGSLGIATYQANNTWVTGAGLGVRF